MDLFRDVLEGNLAELLRVELDLVEHEIVHVLREADAARPGQGLKAGRYVDALAEGVVLVEVDVAEVDADPHEEGQTGILLIVLVQPVLNLHGALEGLDRILEIEEESVADSLDDFAVMAFGDARDEVVVVVEELQRSRLVVLHHAGESGDVRVHYGREAVVRLFHCKHRINR